MRSDGGLLGKIAKTNSNFNLTYVEVRDENLAKFYFIYHISTTSVIKQPWWLNGRASLFGREGCGFEPHLG